MAPRNGRSTDEVRRAIGTEREQLARSVDDLRASISAVADVGGKLRARLPLVAAGALGAGFFLAGGIGATMRLIMRRSRERTSFF